VGKFKDDIQCPAGAAGQVRPAGAKRRGDRKTKAPCSAPTSAGGLADDVVL